MIELISEHELSAQTEAEISGLLRQSFPTDFGGRSFYQQRPHLRLIWRDGGVQSHVSLFLRAIRLGEDLVDVMGVGDVATCPEARGQGHATALMRRTIEIGQASRADFLVLFGARHLYDRAGFHPVEVRYRHVQMTGARTGEVAETTSRFFRVRELGDRRWPADHEVDFLGPLF